jgi:hypothetical protein
MGGSLHTVPAQATVMMLGRSPGRAQLTMTAGAGFKRLPGFQVCFMTALQFLYFYRSSRAARSFL